MPSLIAFATQWGSKYGGINSFNTDFLTAFGNAYHDEVQVICIVTTTNNDEIAHAAKNHVTLVKLPYEPKNKPFTAEQAKAAINQLKEDAIHFDSENTVWLGHDRISGEAAIEAAKSAGGRSALIHHMSYNAYEAFAEDSRSADTKKREQKVLFKQANLVLAVGPFLRDALKDLIATSPKPVHMIIPGLAEIIPIATPIQFSAFLSGRLSDDAAKIKQGHLGVAAFAKAIANADQHNAPENLVKRPKLVLRGVDFESSQNYNQSSPTNPEAELQEFAESYAAGARINLQALPFTQNRDELYDDLKSASVALMPSWHEGFGLVAWEAIAAGVPLIVSKESGVYQFLDDFFNGAQKGYIEAIKVKGISKSPFFHPDDLDNVANAITHIARNPEQARIRAAQLRTMLSEYTWEACVEKAAEYFSWQLKKNTLLGDLVLMDNIQSIKSWFKILGWTSSPKFGPCHSIESYNDFEKQYYCSEELLQLEMNILQSLKDGNTSCIKFMGAPGCGKTSFLYHLWKKSCNDPSSDISHYFFYIFHANRADDPNEYRELTRKHILQAWEQYYSACQLSDVFIRINNCQISKKEKLGELTDYFRSHKRDFSKTLIVIIDDIDLLDDDMAFKISSAIKRDIELASVILWVSIRPNTLRHYCAATRNFFKEFFPEVYTYPTVSLYKVISHRISVVSEDECKNPFSKALCDEILFLLFEGNKRASLSSLKAILENTLPKKIRNSESEEFIQNYIEQMAIKTFIIDGTLPNIHDVYFRSTMNYPLPYDIIQICRYSKDKNIILGVLNEIAKQRSRKSPVLSNLEREIQIRETDLNYSINKLCNAGVLSKELKNHILLTDTGMVLAKYSAREYYNEKCKQLLLDVDETYWEHHKQHINYEVVVDTYHTWKKQQY